MKPKHTKLAREQLDATLANFASLMMSVPRKGWIRAIRGVIGMTGEQLAKRLNVNKQRVSRIEHDETLGKVKVETLRNVASALDCIFVYAFVPKTSLEQAVRKQAEVIAQKRMERSNQTMRLENQELSPAEKSKVLKNMVDEIIETMPKSLWDEQ